MSRNSTTKFELIGLPSNLLLSDRLLHFVDHIMLKEINADYPFNLRNNVSLMLSTPKKFNYLDFNHPFKSECPSKPPKPPLNSQPTVLGQFIGTSLLALMILMKY